MKKAIIIAASLVAAVALGAQTSAKFGWLDGRSADPDKLLPGVNPSKVVGDIITSGSSTVAPLTSAVIEQFKKEGYRGQVTVDSIGSGAGFERFCKNGEADVANASRAIKASEVGMARAIGREPLEFRIGTDAIAVCVSKANTFAKNLTKAELALVFGKAVYWSDVNPAWPKKEILRYIPGTDSGTLDYFVEVVYAKDRTAMLSATNTSKSEDDNTNVLGIEGSPYAVGFFGFAYYAENKGKMNVLSVDGIEPSQANVDSAKYPLARPLFMYTTAKIMAEKPQVAAFIDYYLSNVNRVIKKVGYFPAHVEDLKKAKRAWLAAVKGRY